MCLLMAGADFFLIKRVICCVQNCVFIQLDIYTFMYLLVKVFYIALIFPVLVRHHTVLYPFLFPLETPILTCLILKKEIKYLLVLD